MRFWGNTIDPDDAKWAASNGPEIRERFVRAGLLEPPEQEMQAKKRKTVEQHLADYIARNAGSKKPATVTVWNQVVADLKKELPKGI